MKLYEITENMAGLQTLADTEELTPEMIADTMDGLKVSFNEKAKAILQVRQSIIGEIDMIAAEMERLHGIADSKQNSRVGLERYLKSNMVATGADKLDLGLFKVTLRKAFVMLGDITEEVVPNKFWVKFPATKRLDKKAVLAAAKLKPVKGVQLIDSERALIIK